MLRIILQCLIAIRKRKNIIKIGAAFFCSVLCLIAVGQDKEKVSWPLIAYVSGGQSIFRCDPSGPEPSKFPTAEFRLGAGTSYEINHLFEVRTRLVFGVKLKRESVNKPGQPVVVGSPYFSLDETASNINHFFYEIPILVQFNFPHPAIGLRVGRIVPIFLSE